MKEPCPWCNGTGDFREVARQKLTGEPPMLIIGAKIVSGAAVVELAGVRYTVATGDVLNVRYNLHK